MLLIFFLIFYLIVLKKYDAISSFYVERRAMFFEGILSIIIFYIIFITQKRGKLRYIKAALPVLLVYIFIDIYFKSFGTVFKFVAVYQLWELVRVADFYILLFLCILIVFIPIFLLISIDYKEWRRIALGVSLIFLVMYCVEWNPKLYLKMFHGVGSKINEWSDVKSVENGRLAMLFYWEAKRVKVTKDLQNVRTNNDYAYDLNLLRDSLKRVRSKRSVHLIILESFFDPSLLTKITFSRNPMHPNLLRHVGTKPALSESPVFGGRSAQAEFEILCGIPAFADFSDIEFSVFGGKINHSLPALLSGAGYITMATNSYRPDFFNSDVAYKGLGFPEAYFPKEYSSLKPTYFSHGDVGEEKFMFDGDLFKQNLDYYFSRKKISGGAPIFNYVVSNYGHFPFTLDYNKRPKIIDVVVPPEFNKEPIERIANQFYYRSKALGEFLDELKKMDPEAVVVIVGDHLPTIEPVDKIKYGYKAYGILGYLGGIDNAHRYSFLFITCSGKKILFEHVSHYNIPEIILDCLTDGEYCSRSKCFLPRENYHDRYVNIMAQAIRH
jgi:hypothetical protein